MIVNLYSILDKKTATYHQPQFLTSDGQAVRELHRLVNHTDGTMHFYPEDYDLYMVGTFNMISGKVMEIDKPKIICTAISLKQTEVK